MRQLYEYKREALDLALASKRYLASGDRSELESLCAKLEELVAVPAEHRMRAHRSRTGVTARYLEEETQALLVATLRQDPLTWSRICSVCAPAIEAGVDDGSCGRCGGLGYHPGVVVVHHSPDGYNLSKFQAAAAKRAGGQPGWPDLDVRLMTGRGPHNVMIELKAGKGRERDNQRVVREELEAAGYDARIVWGLRDALLAVLEHLVDPVREEVPF